MSNKFIKLSDLKEIICHFLYSLKSEIPEKN